MITTALLQNGLAFPVMFFAGFVMGLGFASAVFLNAIKQKNK